MADTVPDGQTPHTVSVCLYDELVDAVKPGDRVTLTGIFRSVSVRINPKQRVIKSLFKTYVDVVHIKRTDAKRLAVDHDTRDGDDRRGAIGVGGNDEEEAGDSALTQATRSDSQERLLELSKRTDIYDYLARSLAPSIYEMDDVKKGILLQLFGGTNKTIARGGGGGGPRYRGDINVLLVGDPGTSKSQMLQVRPQTSALLAHPATDVSAAPVCAQDRTSRRLHLWEGLVCRRPHCLCHSRPRHKATGPREWRPRALGWWRLLHRRV